MVPLTYLAQVRRIRRICAFLQYPKHPRLALITRRFLPFNATEKSTVLLKVAVILGHAQDVELCGRNKNMVAWYRGLEHSQKQIKFTSSRLHVVAKKLQNKRLMMDTDNGLINCWMLGDYRVSVLIKNGRMFRSQNVKRGGIHIRTFSRRFVPLILSPMTGGKSASPMTDNRARAMYRRGEVSILHQVSFGQDWAKNMTLRQREKSKPYLVTWLNIYSRTTFLTPFGLRTGDEFVTVNPFLSSIECEQIVSSFSNYLTGRDYQNLRSLSQQLMPTVRGRLNSG